MGHVAYLIDRVRQVVILFHEVKRAEGQQLKTDAHVAMEIKPVQHLHTETEGEREREREREREIYTCRETGRQTGFDQETKKPNIVS